MRDKIHSGTVEVESRWKSSTRAVLLLLLIIVLVVAVFIIAKVFKLMKEFGQ